MTNEPASAPVLIPGAADADRYWLETAIGLSEKCPPSDSAFAVGAVVVSALGRVIATGYSRELTAKDHAEEVALARAARPGAAAPGNPSAADLDGPADLSQATLYSSLEPCIKRASRSTTCAELIVAAGIRRVVFAWREPPVFVPGGGAAWLADRGVAVHELTDLGEQARAINARLLR